MNNPEKNMGEVGPKTGMEILQKALAKLKEAGLDAQLLQARPTTMRDRRPDATITLAAGGHTARLDVEIKAAVAPAALGHVMAQWREPGPPIMLITRYITPPMAKRLIEQNIPFADTAGNVYIKMPGLFVHVTGRKLPRVEALTIRAFRPKGLQAIFALLCRPDLVKAPYRRIGDAAGVALGTVERVMDDLKRLDHLVERPDHGRKLVNVRKLLDAWVMNYAQHLRPKHFLGRFHGLLDQWWKAATQRGLPAYVGGEIAAAQVTHYLKPERITVYLEGDLDAFLQRHRLVRDDAGETELLRTFWHFPYDRRYDCPHPHQAPPLLVYADLMATANARTIETGKMIYDRYLAGLVRED